MDCLGLVSIVLRCLDVLHRRGHELLLRLHVLLSVHRLGRCLHVLYRLMIVRWLVHGMLLLVVVL